MHGGVLYMALKENKQQQKNATKQVVKITTEGKKGKYSQWKKTTVKNTEAFFDRNRITYGPKSLLVKFQVQNCKYNWFYEGQLIPFLTLNWGGL